MSIAKVGEKYLVSTDDWFYAPDGQNYKAVFGTVRAILNDADTLGIKTNAKSTNWYLAIGNMLVAGCQIHYAIRTDECSKNPAKGEATHENTITEVDVSSRVYFADEVTK